MGEGPDLWPIDRITGEQQWIILSRDPNHPQDPQPLISLHVPAILSPSCVLRVVLRSRHPNKLLISFWPHFRASLSAIRGPNAARNSGGGLAPLGLWPATKSTNNYSRLSARTARQATQMANYNLRASCELLGGTPLLISRRAAPVAPPRHRVGPGSSITWPTWPVKL